MLIEEMISALKGRK